MDDADGPAPATVGSGMAGGEDRTGDEAANQDISCDVNMVRGDEVT